MPLIPRPCPSCPAGVCEVNRTRCYRCLHPGRPVPACSCCGSDDYYVSGYCRACHPRLGIPESCRSCLGWTATRLRGMCNPCYQFAQRNPAGTCRGCARTVPVRHGLCRLCLIQAGCLWGPVPVPPPGRIRWHQLFFADAIHRPAAEPPRPELAPLPWARPQHAQMRLCDPPRDMSQVRLRDREPADPLFAAYLLSELNRRASLHGWPAWQRDRMLWIVGRLAAVHAGDEQIKASTVTSAGCAGGYGARQAMVFLAGLGLLCDDRPDVLGAWIDARLSGVRSGIREEAHAWIDVLRHGGPHTRPKAEATVRAKISYITAFLGDVSARHASLREVTTQEITRWLAGRPAAFYEAGAIRSLFKTLASRRLIFADPARTLHTGQRLASQPVPLWQTLALTVGTAAGTDPALSMVVALIGIHGMYPKQARELPLDAVDLRQGRLIHGELNRPLDSYTRQAAAGYLAYRRQRWPAATSPYLLVSSMTVHTGQPVTSTWLHNLLRALPVTAQQLRDDRLLEEAAHCGGDAMHLAAMFGIGPQASLRYAKAAPGNPAPGTSGPRTRT
jgi:hypothetical protein